MITLEEAKRRQDELQAEGRELLDRYMILSLLDPLGELQVDGSFKYGLMVKPDIDAHIYSEKPDIKAVGGAVKQLFLIEALTRVLVSNKQSFVVPQPGTPKGIYLNFRIFYKDRDWNFDVWIVKPEDALNKGDFVKGWYKRLTVEQRETILVLKYNLKEAGRYPGVETGMFASADIYRAVMTDGIKTIEELDEWRKTHPYY